MSTSLNYNGTSLASYGLTVLDSTPLPVWPGARLYRKDVPQRHGGVGAGGKTESRRIQVSCIVEGSSISDLQSKLDTIKRLLNPDNGSKAFYLDAMSDRMWYGQLATRIEAQVIGAVAARLLLVFDCADPLAYATSLTTQTVTVSADPHSFNVPASSTVAGSVEALPVWTVRNTDAASATGVAVENTTRSETISVAYTVPTNAYVRIDTARELVEYSADGTTWTPIMSAIITAPLYWPKLTPGVANACKVHGLTAGTLAISYRARYL